MSEKIRFSFPEISNQDVILTSKILKSGWLTHGQYTERI